MEYMNSGINDMVLVDGNHVNAAAKCGELEEEKERLALALKEYDCFNEIRNDLDAYLSHLSCWAWQNTEKLVEIYDSTDMPKRKDYGLE